VKHFIINAHYVLKIRYEKDKSKIQEKAINIINIINDFNKTIKNIKKEK
jgi:hypothetical protein